MSPRPPSGAVRAGHALVSGLLVFAVAFAAFAVVSMAVGVARDGNSLLYGETLSVPLQVNPEELGPLPAGVRFRGWPDVTVEVKDPTSREMLLRSAMDFGPLLLFIGGLWLLRGFARSVKEGDPFGSDNVQRLRRLGFLLVLGAPAVELLNYALRSDLYNDLPPNRLDIGVAGFSLPAGAMLGGLGAFILAEVFVHGVRLREDVEGTV
jgi:hypothetical protein